MYLQLILCIGIAATSAQYVKKPDSPVQISPKLSQKYHAQDQLGQYVFGHIEDNHVREEAKSVDGTVRGAYSYVDPKAKIIHVRYVADRNGFRILGANNLPIAPKITLKPIKETREVAEARAAFEKEFQKASKTF